MEQRSDDGRMLRVLGHCCCCCRALCPQYHLTLCTKPAPPPISPPTSAVGHRARSPHANTHSQSSSSSSCACAALSPGVRATRDQNSAVLFYAVIPFVMKSMWLTFTHTHNRLCAEADGAARKKTLPASYPQSTHWNGRTTEGECCLCDNIIMLRIRAAERALCCLVFNIHVRYIHADMDMD